MGQAQRASELSYDAIQQYAERIGTKYKIYDADGRANLKDLVKTLGGQIEYVDTDESLFVADEGKFTIFLPNHTSQRRDQFTLAHELGHTSCTISSWAKLAKWPFSAGVKTDSKRRRIFLRPPF